MINNGFENFVQKDKFDQIVGLTLEEWIKNVLLGETYDYDDWLKRVEFKMSSQFARFSQVHDVFHLDIDTNVQDGEVKLKVLDKVIWDEIKSKIKTNPKLSEEKSKQLWELLE